MVIDHLRIQRRVAKVYHEYYSLSECVPTRQNFDWWIESLDEPMKSCFKKLGFEACWPVLNYRRFILELADIGLHEFLRERLSEEDYRYAIGK